MFLWRTTEPLLLLPTVTHHRSSFAESWTSDDLSAKYSHKHKSVSVYYKTLRILLARCQVKPATYQEAL